MRFLIVVATAAAVVTFAWPYLRGSVRALPPLPADNVLIAVGFLALAVVLLIFTVRAEQ